MKQFSMASSPAKAKSCFEIIQIRAEPGRGQSVPWPDESLPKSLASKSPVAIRTKVVSVKKGKSRTAIHSSLKCSV